MLRLLREGAVGTEGRDAAAMGAIKTPRRVRVELPLPPADRNTDELLYLGLHGQAADWSGGIQQRARVTKGYVEDAMLDGYPFDVTINLESEYGRLIKIFLNLYKEMDVILQGAVR